LEKPITTGEVRLLSALARCRIPAGTVDRRFVEVMSESAAAADGLRLTSGQRDYIRRLAARYRHQLPPELLDPALQPVDDGGETPPDAGRTGLEELDPA
jgi:hypothetical protein